MSDSVERLDSLRYQIISGCPLCSRKLHDGHSSRICYHHQKEVFTRLIHPRICKPEVFILIQIMSLRRGLPISICDLIGEYIFHYHGFLKINYSYGNLKPFKKRKFTDDNLMDYGALLY
jgi:hypothetical protein